MLKIGITGQNGFVGKHLINTLKLSPSKFEIIPFENHFFEKQNTLNSFVAQCDVIVHLAALNRHQNQEVIYNTNIDLTQKLVLSLNETNSKAHVLISSSTQEEQDNLYGKSKKLGRELLIDWAKKSKVKVSGLIIPNVFGPFCKPNYNSVIATFCHKLTHGETPNVIIDSEVDLIYVGDLVQKMIDIIENQALGFERTIINSTKTIKVSSILEILNHFKTLYFDIAQIPDLKTTFEVNLFNTFRSYIELEDFFPKKFKLNTDQRGTFVEVIRLGIGGQVSFSTTVPGITRGNHYHTRKIERFAVIKGNATIQLRKIGTNEIVNFDLKGDEPAFVDMPVWYTHNITNVGNEELLTLFWINEFYDPNDADTYFEDV